jgi:signal transduction histidine kinase
VAGGIARSTGLPVFLVRAGFVALALAAGVGVVGYLAAWALLPADDGGTVAAGGGEVLFQIAAIAAIAVGATLLLAELGVLLGRGHLGPLILLGLGVAVLWWRSDRERWTAAADGNGSVGTLRAMAGGRAAGARLAVGALLVAAGVAGFLATNADLASARDVLVPVTATLVGLALILGPWWLRLARNVAEERRERIRSEERAEMAARIHDSVLQTLALIQRSAERPQQTVLLARRQERELRAWLFAAGADEDDPGTLRAAMERMAADVEELHEVSVELVVVGDAPLDERTQALIRATREALVNAAKFSGAPAVSAYVEVTPATVNAFVRDRGRGFDPDAVPADRQGIRESIVRRIERAGGLATITSAPGEGAEVQIELPREA